MLFVGVLRYYKGIDYLLEAMRRIPARLLVVGDGPMGQELRGRAAKLELGDRVCFLGSVTDDDLAAIYHIADVFVLPASERSEAFGLVQVEAMTCGVPVVCTELGTGTSFVNQHEVTGLVVPPKDPDALAEAITRLLRNPDERERLARGAVARSAFFEADRMVTDILAVYDQLLL